MTMRRPEKPFSRPELGRAATSLALLLTIVALPAAHHLLASPQTPPATPPAPERTPEPAPLTVVAPAPRAVDAGAHESPARRLRQMNLGPPPQDGIEWRLPPATVMDVTQPPQWTRPLALPLAQPQPPDPFETPPLAVDPQRVPLPELPRRSLAAPAYPGG